MKAETAALIERPYQEIVDDILTAIVGGVVNEPLRFDVKTDLYPLAEPARDVRGITGVTEDGTHHQFLKAVDFRFSESDNAVIWLKDGTWPDDDSLFYVDYFRRSSRSPLTDINVGSVTRTLSEAIGREIATVYQQINLAYLAGFIDTATGTSLDLVVSILGVERRTKDFAVGLVTFFRDQAVQGNITISEGTALATSKGDVVFETTQLRTLQRGQARIDIPVRASDGFKGDVGIVPAGSITRLSQGIAGIGGVNNFEATFLGGEDESDDELRARAKAALFAVSKGTLGALIDAVFKARAEVLEIWDPNGPPASRTEPGSVTLLIGAEPERFPSVRAAVEETRAAGVRVTMVARYIFFKPRIAARITPGITGAGKEKVINDIIAALQAYVDGLTSGQPAEGEALLKAVRGVKDVRPETRIVDVMTWYSDVGTPANQTLLDAVLLAAQSTPPGDAAALRLALDQAINETPTVLPSGTRIPNRDLLAGANGRATDAEIEEGKFQVLATLNGEQWWVVLDIEPADIALIEQGA